MASASARARASAAAARLRFRRRPLLRAGRDVRFGSRPCFRRGAGLRFRGGALARRLERCRFGRGVSVRFGEGACVLGPASFGAHDGFPLGPSTEHRRDLRAILGFDSRAREVPCFGLGLGIRLRRFGRPRFQLLARARGDRPVLFGAHAELRGQTRLVLGPQPGLGLARRGRFRFDPSPGLLRRARFRVDVDLPGAPEVILEPRPFLLRGAECRVERVADAERLECTRLGFRPLARFLHGGLLGPHERFGQRLRDRVGVGAFVRGGAGLGLGGRALERDLRSAGLGADARFGLLHQCRFGLIERRRRRGGVDCVCTRVFCRPLGGGTGVESESDVGRFLDSHGSLRGRRVGRRNH